MMFEFYTEEKDLQGNVINVFEKQCIVEIEESQQQQQPCRRNAQIIVHFELYLLHNEKPVVLPRIGDRLLISKYYKNNFNPGHVFVNFNASAAVISISNHQSSSSSSSRNQKPNYWSSDNEYVKLVRTNKMSIEHVLIFKTFYPTVLYKNLSSFDIKLKLLDYFLQNKNAAATGGGKLKIPVFKTIRECIYASENALLQKALPHPHPPELANGIHCHNKSGEHLIGFLKTNDESGLIQIELEGVFMIVKIITRDNYKLKFAINKIVIVSKFVCFTELYARYNEAYNFVVFDEKDMYVLDLGVKVEEKRRRRLICDSVPENLHFKNILFIYLISIGTPSVGTSKRQELHCWLEVEIQENSTTTTGSVCFLCLPKSHISAVLPFLQAGNFYSLHMNQNLNRFVNEELDRVNINKSKSFILSDPNTLFVLDRKKARDKLRVEGVNSKIELIFKIEKKFMNKPDLYSRTGRLKKTPFFGIPGDLVPTILLPNKKKIYLNNWEPKCYPFGLVPQLTVKITNITERNGYFLSNALTNVEVLSYDGIRNVKCINMANPKVNPEVFYGYLGNGHYVPIFSVVRSLVLIHSFKSFKLFYESEYNRLNLRASLFVRDCKGESLVMCNLVSLLEKMLPKVSLQPWKNVLEQMEKFSIYICDNNDIKPYFYPFCKLFQEWFTNLFSLHIIYLDISCRKMNEEGGGGSYDNKGCPVWWALEISDVIF